jgi:tetratricopeptide (TPR) repeat protein
MAPHIQKETQARYYELAQEFTKATEVYQELFREFPDSFDFGMHLAELQAWGGDEAGMRATLALLRQMPAPINDSPRIDNAEVVALLMARSFREADALAERARAKAATQGSRLVEAQALLLAARTRELLGRHDDSVTAVEQAKAIYQAAGDREGLAKALSFEAFLRGKHGEADAVRKIQDQVFSISRELGNATEMVRVKQMVGSSLATEGDWPGALKQFEDAVEIARSQPDKNELAGALFGRARVQNMLGDVAGFSKTVDELGALELNEAEMRGTVLAMRAAVLGIGDHFDEEREILVEAIARPEYKGPVRAAMRLQLAQAYVDADRFADAEREARAAIDDSASTGANGKICLAEALIGLGRLAEARPLLDAAAAMPSWSSALMRAIIAVPQARLLAASKKPADVAAAARSLRAMIEELHAQHLLPGELQMRVELGKLLADTAEGKEILAAVAKDATAAGYLAYARRAR